MICCMHCAYQSVLTVRSGISLSLSITRALCAEPSGKRDEDNDVRKDDEDGDGMRVYIAKQFSNFVG